MKNLDFFIVCQLSDLQKQLNSKQMLTPTTELRSDIVTCLARSTAVATCCWCSWDKKGNTWPMMADIRLTISVCKKMNNMKRCVSLHQEPNVTCLDSYQCTITNTKKNIRKQKGLCFKYKFYCVLPTHCTELIMTAL